MTTLTRAALATIVLASAMSVTPAAQDPARMGDKAPLRLTSRTTPAGPTMVWEISPDRAREQPHWDPAGTAAPFSASDVLGDVTKWLAQKTPDAQRFELQAIVLSRMHRGAEIDFWFYQLDFFAYGAVRSTEPLVRAVVLPDRSIVEPRTLPVTGSQTPGPATPPSPQAASPGVSYPRLLTRVDAQYTEEARRRKIAGTVLIDCVVNVDGTVGDIRVARSLDAQFGLDEEAVKAVKQYRFTPGTKDGQPVPVRVSIEVSFYVK